MSDPPPIVRAVVDDVRSTSWQRRVQTMGLTLGVLAFGVMLGTHYYAAVVMDSLPAATASTMGILEPLQSRYTQVMKVGALVAIVSLCGAMAVDIVWGEDSDEEPS